VSFTSSEARKGPHRALKLREMKRMRIALFGATGRIGQRILQEALIRGHEVTAIIRNPARLSSTSPRLKRVKGDVLDPTRVAATVVGHEVVISAIGPGIDADPHVLVEAAHSLLAGLKEAGVKRLLVVGGSGSLEVSPGTQFIDNPGFPIARKPIAMAQRDALEAYRRDATLDWTYVSPPASIEPGQRTGKYRTGGNQLVTDKQGRSFISMEDYAVALVDEVENPRFIRRRFTVAY